MLCFRLPIFSHGNRGLPHRIHCLKLGIWILRACCYWVNPVLLLIISQSDWESVFIRELHCRFLRELLEVYVLPFEIFGMLKAHGIFKIIGALKNINNIFTWSLIHWLSYLIFNPKSFCARTLPIIIPLPYHQTLVKFQEILFYFLKKRSSISARGVILFVGDLCAIRDEWMQSLLRFPRFLCDDFHYFWYFDGKHIKTDFFC